jgi:hypothetical protein
MVRRYLRAAAGLFAAALLMGLPACDSYNSGNNKNDNSQKTKKGDGARVEEKYGFTSEGVGG